MATNNALLAQRLREPRQISLFAPKEKDERTAPDQFPNTSNTMDLLDALRGDSGGSSGGGGSTSGGSNSLDIMRMRNMMNNGGSGSNLDFGQQGNFTGQQGQGWSGNTFTPAASTGLGGSTSAAGAWNSGNIIPAFGLPEAGSSSLAGVGGGGAAAGGATGLGSGATFTSMYGLPAAGGSSLAGGLGGGSAGAGGAAGGAGMGAAAMAAGPLALFAGGMLLALWRANKHKKFLSNKHANQTEEEKRQEMANSLAYNSDPNVMAEIRQRERQGGE